MFESNFISNNLPIEIIALDEVGRSPLCGPVVIGGVRLIVEDKNSFLTLLRSLRAIGVKDSKALSKEKRSKLLMKLGLDNSTFRNKSYINYKDHSLSLLTVDISAEVIDEINIFQSVLLGMRDVVSGLAENQIKHTLILIDGPFYLDFNPQDKRWIEVPVVQGDVKSTLIGLASVHAKESRDSYMRKLHESYPQYGFNENVGYPTKAHREALKFFGATPYHRKSFGIVKELQSKLVE